MKNYYLHILPACVFALDSALSDSAPKHQWPGLEYFALSQDFFCINLTEYLIVYAELNSDAWQAAPELS